MLLATVGILQSTYLYTRRTDVHLFAYKLFSTPDDSFVHGKITKINSLKLHFLIPPATKQMTAREQEGPSFHVKQQRYDDGSVQFSRRRTSIQEEIRVRIRRYYYVSPCSCETGVTEPKWQFALETM